MRQWMIEPELLCRKHLLGEHVENHMFVGIIKKGISIKGYINKGLLEPEKLHSRHDSIVKEMKRRGYNHNSPLPQLNLESLPSGNIDINKNILDLKNRCKECSERITDKEE